MTDAAADDASASTWQRVKAVFHEALEVDRDERDAWLDEACGDDGRLHEEVSALLQAHDVNDAFIEPPDATVRISATQSAVPTGDEVSPGSHIGAYRIVDTIAAGGMGVVYLAERAAGDFDKKVAIKVLKRGLDTDALLHRFASERQALASLEHPGIARLLDGGALADGRPYLVMEYIEGIPVTRYCDEHRLTVTQRLQLFRRAIDAVRHAHRHLVIHRDLKSEHILVTPDRTPKLVDFGVAKLLDASAGNTVNEANSRPMTLEYASPEQIRGDDMTTATDVFSLGVVLFELLTGQRPHPVARDNSGAPVSSATRRRATLEAPAARASSAAARGGVAEAPPDTTLSELAARRGTTPARLAARLRGDIDSILAQALEKDPDHRYASVEAFDLDLQRHLRSEPIASRASSLGYRVARFARRHVVALVIVGAFAALVIGSLVVLFTQQGVIERQRDEAVAARVEADRVVEFLESMLASAEPGRGGPDATVRELLDESAQRLSADLTSLPSVRARLHTTLGRSYQALGLFDTALAQYEIALELRRALQGDHHPDVATCYSGIATLQSLRARYPEARVAIEAALSIRRRHASRPDPLLAQALSDLGAILRASGDAPGARDAYERAAEYVEVGSLIEADLLNNRANLARHECDYESAREHMSRALEIRRERLPPDHPRILQSLTNVAALRSETGDAEGAEKSLREAVAVARRVLGTEHRDLAMMLGNLAMLVEMRGNHAEAERIRAETAAILEKALPEGSWRTSLTHCLRACSLVELGRPDEARRIFDEHLDAVAAELGERQERVARFRRVRATLDT